jgi:hypothetical protein
MFQNRIDSDFVDTTVNHKLAQRELLALHRRSIPYPLCCTAHLDYCYTTQQQRLEPAVFFTRAGWKELTEAIELEWWDCQNENSLESSLNTDCAQLHPRNPSVGIERVREQRPEGRLLLGGHRGGRGEFDSKRAFAVSVQSYNAYDSWVTVIYL